MADARGEPIAEHRIRDWEIAHLGARAEFDRTNHTGLSPLQRREFLVRISGTPGALYMIVEAPDGQKCELMLEVYNGDFRVFCYRSLGEGEICDDPNCGIDAIAQDGEPIVLIRVPGDVGPTEDQNDMEATVA